MFVMDTGGIRSPNTSRRINCFKNDESVNKHTSSSINKSRMEEEERGAGAKEESVRWELHG